MLFLYHLQCIIMCIKDFLRISCTLLDFNSGIYSNISQKYLLKNHWYYASVKQWSWFTMEAGPCWPDFLNSPAFTIQCSWWVNPYVGKVHRARLLLLLKITPRLLVASKNISQPPEYGSCQTSCSWLQLSCTWKISS